MSFWSARKLVRMCLWDRVSQVVLVVKNQPASCRRRKRFRFNPCVRKIPWRSAGHPTPVILPGESHGQRSLAGCSPQGRTESDTTKGNDTQHVSLGSLKPCTHYLNIFTLWVAAGLRLHHKWWHRNNSDNSDFQVALVTTHLYRRPDISIRNDTEILTNLVKESAKTI